MEERGLGVVLPFVVVYVCSGLCPLDGAPASQIDHLSVAPQHHPSKKPPLCPTQNPA